MNEKMSAYVNKFNDFQVEATKEVMRMTFFLNCGGIATTLTAFGSSVLKRYSCLMTICLLSFLLGLICSIVMAIELRTFAIDMFSKATEPSVTEDELKIAVEKHHGRRTVFGLCITSLIFFAIGIVVGFIVLLVSLKQ